MLSVVSSAPLLSLALLPLPLLPPLAASAAATHCFSSFSCIFSGKARQKKKMTYSVSYVSTYKVHILDGGLPAWVAAGYELETSVPVLPLETPYAASGEALLRLC